MYQTGVKNAVDDSILQLSQLSPYVPVFPVLAPDVMEQRLDIFAMSYSNSRLTETEHNKIVFHYTTHFENDLLYSDRWNISQKNGHINGQSLHFLSIYCVMVLIKIFYHDH